MSKLKAFVRYDATGRIIAGSLILQRSKPKVGDWKQIDAYECCNPTTSTSTTVAFYPLSVCIYRDYGMAILNGTLTFTSLDGNGYPVYQGIASTGIGPQPYELSYYPGTTGYGTNVWRAYQTNVGGGGIPIISDSTTAIDPSAATWSAGTVTSGACPT